MPGEVVAKAPSAPAGVVTDDPLGDALRCERVDPFGEREEIGWGGGHDAGHGARCAAPRAAAPVRAVVSAASQCAGADFAAAT